MVEDTVAVGSVTVETSGLFPRRHRLWAGGALVGEMAFGLGSPVSYIGAGGKRLRMARASPWRTEYRMWEGGEERASARLRPLRRQVEVLFAGLRFLLYPTGLRPVFWTLIGADGVPVLTVRRAGLRRAEIEIHTPTALDLLVFAYYLTVILQRAARRRG